MLTFMVKEDKKKMSKYDKIDISIPRSSVHSNWKLLPTSMKLTFLQAAIIMLSIVLIPLGQYVNTRAKEWYYSSGELHMSGVCISGEKGKSTVVSGAIFSLSLLVTTDLRGHFTPLKLHFKTYSVKKSWQGIIMLVDIKFDQIPPVSLYKLCCRTVVELL